MEEIKVAICDDEILLLPQLAAMIRRFFLTNNLEVKPDTFSSSAELLARLYRSECYDVYFLDIDIPEQDGITLAEKIKAKNPESLIVFVSAKEELVYDTFRVQPLAFVRKSCFSKDIKKAMETVMKHLKKPADTEITFYDELGHPILLNINRITYVEAKEKYQDIVSIDSHQMIRCAISDLENTLEPYRFIRIHRGYLVNFQYIYRIDTNHIILDDGQKLPLSRHRKKEVQRLFLEYARTKKNF